MEADFDATKRTVELYVSFQCSTEVDRFKSMKLFSKVFNLSFFGNKKFYWKNQLYKQES